MIAIYLHAGNNKLIREKEIIGIFDMDTATVSNVTRKYLNNAEKKGEVMNLCDEIPKAFLLCGKKGKFKIFISQLSTSTLQKRIHGSKSFKNK